MAVNYSGASSTRITPAQAFVLRLSIGILHFWYAKLHILRVEGPAFTAQPNMVVFANHRKIYDSFLLGVALFGECARTAPHLLPMNIPKRKWYTQLWPVSALLRLWRATPIKIDRDNRTRDPGAMRRIAQVLKNGGVVQIFPEGTREKKDGQLLPIRKSACSHPITAGSSLLIVYHTQTQGEYRVFRGRLLSGQEVATVAGEGTLSEKSERLAALVTLCLNKLRLEAIQTQW